jgi:hypothetical protein
MDFPRRLLKVAIICILITIWIISFAASARLAEEGHNAQQVEASALATGTSTVMDSPSLPTPISQVNTSAALQRSMFSEACSRICTVLALVAFVVPLGFSILSILWVQHAHRRQSPRWLGILFSIRPIGHAAPWRGNPILQQEVKL